MKQNQGEKERKSIIIPYSEIPPDPQGHISPITIYAPLTRHLEIPPPQLFSLLPIFWLNFAIQKGFLLSFFRMLTSIFKSSLNFESAYNLTILLYKENKNVFFSTILWGIIYKLFLLCLTSTCFVLSPSRSIGVSWQKVLACFPSFLFFSLFAKNFPQRFVYWMKLNKQW